MRNVVPVVHANGCICCGCCLRMCDASVHAKSGLQGAVANFVETEQLVELRASQGKESITSSFVQVRFEV